MARPRPMKGMGIIADPHRKVIKKRGGKKPAKPGWGQALLGRSRRGWSLGGALNSKRKGYQSGRTVNPRAKGEEAMKTQRRMKWNNRTTPVPAGWGAYGSPFSSNARFPSPPGGWNKGGPTKFRDDQSLGIRDGKVRKPVGYQGGGTSGYSDAYLQGQGVDPAMYRTANRKLMKQKRQNILSGKSVRTRQPKRITSKKGPKGG